MKEFLRCLANHGSPVVAGGCQLLPEHSRLAASGLLPGAAPQFYCGAAGAMPGCAFRRAGTRRIARATNSLSGTPAFCGCCKPFRTRGAHIRRIALRSLAESAAWGSAVFDHSPARPGLVIALCLCKQPDLTVTVPDCIIAPSKPTANQDQPAN